MSQIRQQLQQDMAEVVGAASSVAGLVSLAGQLLDGAMKLKRFCERVKDAPRRLETLAFEIETLSLTLHGIEANRQRHIHLESTIVERCLKLCRDGTQRICAMTEDLDKSMLKSRKWASIRTAFKQRGIEDMCNEIERGKSTLSLAYQLYSNEVQAQQLMIIQSTLLDVPQTILNSAQITTSHRPEAPTNLPLGKHGRRRKRRVPREYEVSYTLSLPFLNKAWTFAASQAANGWNWHLRTYNIRSGDSDIFRACMVGDIREIQELLVSGKASVFDVDEYGEGVLHASSMVLEVRAQYADRTTARRSMGKVCRNLSLATKLRC